MQQTDARFWTYVAQFFLKWEMCQTKFLEEIKTHILCSVNDFRNSLRLWDNVEKYGTARQATDENNMAHGLCMLGN